MPAAQVQHQELNRKGAYPMKFMVSVITKTGHNSIKIRIYHDQRRDVSRNATKILFFNIYKQINKDKESNWRNKYTYPQNDVGIDHQALQEWACSTGLVPFAPASKSITKEKIDYIVSEVTNNKYIEYEVQKELKSTSAAQSLTMFLMIQRT